MSEPNECPRLIEVQRLWEGEIAAKRAGDVRQHLAHCSLCQAEYESWDRLSALLARGDPAQPLPSERRQRLREQLLAECAASLVPDQQQDAGYSGGEASAGIEDRELPACLASGAAWYRGRIQIWARLALTLAPLAAAALLLLYAGRPVPVHAPRRSWIDTRSRIASSPPEYHAPPRSPRIAATGHPAPSSRVAAVPRLSGFGARTAAPPVMHDIRTGQTHRVARAPVLPQPQARLRLRPIGRAASHPHLALRPRRDRRAVRLAAIPRASLRSPASQPAIGSGSTEAAAAPRPIQRLVIQADAPPPAPTAKTRPVTHLTIVAEGDPAAPGARLTVIKSQREETLP